MRWQQLKVWQKAHDLVKEVYRLTSTFPQSELYGLTAQLRRSAISVPANIVEGQSRHTTKEYLNFLFTARGSLEETRYHLLLAGDLGFVTKEQLGPLEEGYREASVMLNALIKSLENK